MLTGIHKYVAFRDFLQIAFRDFLQRCVSLYNPGCFYNSVDLTTYVSTTLLTYSYIR